MRELKFRAWNPKSKTMWDNVGYHPHNAERHDDGSMTIAPFLDVPIMQYTGLKDKNGKEIYEGDILLCGDSGEFFSQDYDEEKDEYVNTHKAKVIGPTDSYPAFDIDPNPCEETNGLSQLMATGEMEVIGNIHENAELLKDEEV